MYVTLEPCLMCYNAILASRINKVYYCVERENKIELKTIKYKYNNEKLEEKGKKLLQNFFKNKRKK